VDASRSAFEDCLDASMSDGRYYDCSDLQEDSGLPNPLELVGAIWDVMIHPFDDLGTFLVAAFVWWWLGLLVFGAVANIFGRLLRLIEKKV